MPARLVMKKFHAGKLHSGSKHGPLVTNRDQAIAIMLSEQRAGEGESVAHISSQKNVTKRSRPTRTKR